MRAGTLVRTFAALAFAATGFAVASPASAESRFPKMKEAGVLEVGWGAFPPYEYQDVTSGELKGILIELAKEVAERLGVSADFTLDSWPTMPAGIAAGKFDVALMGYSDGRARIVDYSIPLYVSDFTAVVLGNSTITTWDELNQPGNVMAVTTGSSTDEVLARMQQEGKLKLEVRRIKDVGSGVLAVTGGNVTAYTNQRDSLSLMVKSQPQLRVIDGAFGEAWFGVVVPKGDEEYLANVDKAVKSMRDDGTIAKLIADFQVIGAEVPKN